MDVNSSKSLLNVSGYGNSSGLFLGPNYWKEPVPFMATRLFLEVGITFFGAIGNIVVLIVMTKYPYMNFPMISYIRNLAVSDLGILLINFPFGVIKEQIRSHWILGEFVCVSLYPLSEVFYGVSVWSITAVAIERYRSIVGTTSLVHQTSARGVIVTLATIWLTSFLVISLPILLLIKYDSAQRQCFTVFLSEISLQVYFTTQVIFWFALPLSVISYTYYKISRRITQSNEFHRNMQTQLGQQQVGSRANQPEASATRQNNKAKKILTPLVVVFTIAMLPPNVFRLVLAYSPTILWNRYFMVLYNIFLIFSVANSAANPIIYCMVSKEFRLGVKKLVPNYCLRLSKLSGKRSRNPDAHPTSMFSIHNTSQPAGVELIDVREIPPN